MVRGVVKDFFRAGPNADIYKIFARDALPETAGFQKRIPNRKPLCKKGEQNIRILHIGGHKCEIIRHINNRPDLQVLRVNSRVCRQNAAQVRAEFLRDFIKCVAAPHGVGGVAF